MNRLFFIFIFFFVSCVTMNTYEKFDFILFYGFNFSINTFDSTVTKRLTETKDTAIKLLLTDGEMETVYRKFKEIDILSYPDTFSPPNSDNPDDSMGRAIEPLVMYKLEILINNINKYIYWEDSNVSSSKKAVQLRTTLIFIDSIITNKNEYKDLPRSRLMRL